MQPEEYAAKKSRISAEFSELKWSQQSEHTSSEVIKTYKTPRKFASDSHKTGLQVEADTLQQQGNSPDRRLTLIDLTGNTRNMSKTESVILELNKSTSENSLDPMTVSQSINMNTGYQNKPVPLKYPPQMPLDPPNPPEHHSYCEAFVANQHGNRLIEALPHFSEELHSFTMSGQQGRLMGIGLEQNSSTAFAEFALTDVQLSLNFLTTTSSHSKERPT